MLIKYFNIRREGYNSMEAETLWNTNGHETIPHKPPDLDGGASSFNISGTYFQGHISFRDKVLGTKLPPRISTILFYWFFSCFCLTKPFFFFSRGCPGQLARTSTNPTAPEINNHVSFQWPSYEQPQGSNLRSQREQTSWSQVLTTGPPPRWLQSPFFLI